MVQISIHLLAYSALQLYSNIGLLTLIDCLLVQYLILIYKLPLVGRVSWNLFICVYNTAHNSLLGGV